MHAGVSATGASRLRPGQLFIVVAALLVLVAGCSGGLVLDPAPGGTSIPRSIAAERDVLESVTQLEGEDAVILALNSSQLFFDSAQVVVLADAHQPAAITRAASIAIALGTPMLLTLPDGEHMTAGASVGSVDSGSGTLNTELLRLGTRAVLTVGGVSLHQIDTTSLIISPAPEKIEALSELVGAPLTAMPSPAPDAALKAVALVTPGEVFDADNLEAGPAGYGTFPTVILPAQRRQITVISDETLSHVAALATARAAGATALVAPADPASLTGVVRALAASPTTPVVSMSDRYANVSELVHAVTAMRAGEELPAGGQRVFSVDGHPVRYVITDADSTVATPDVAVSAGEDATDGAAEADVGAKTKKLSPAELVALATTHAVGYTPSETSTVIAAVTLKTGSGRWPQSPQLQDWVTATSEAKQLFLLGFGTSDGVLTDQVERYHDVLADPHVGVNIDLTASSAAIDAGELNDLILLLRGLVRETSTPQRMLQVQLRDVDQIRNLPALLGSTEEVAVVITVTGGDTVEKQVRTWSELRGLRLPVASGWTVVPPAQEPAVEGKVPRPPTPASVSSQLKSLNADPDVLTYP